MCDEIIARLVIRLYKWERGTLAPRPELGIRATSESPDTRSDENTDTLRILSSSQRDNVLRSALHHLLMIRGCGP